MRDGLIRFMIISVLMILSVIVYEASSEEVNDNVEYKETIAEKEESLNEKEYLTVIVERSLMNLINGTEDEILSASNDMISLADYDRKSTVEKLINQCVALNNSGIEMLSIEVKRNNNKVIVFTTLKGESIEDLIIDIYLNENNKIIGYQSYVREK